MAPPPPLHTEQSRANWASFASNATTPSLSTNKRPASSLRSPVLPKLAKTAAPAASLGSWLQCPLPGSAPAPPPKDPNAPKDGYDEDYLAALKRACGDNLEHVACRDFFNVCQAKRVFLCRDYHKGTCTHGGSSIPGLSHPSIIHRTAKKKCSVPFGTLCQKPNCSQAVRVYHISPSCPSLRKPGGSCPGSDLDPCRWGHDHAKVREASHQQRKNDSLDNVAAGK